MKASPKISSCLWFDDQAEEAVKLYTGIFKDSQVHHTNRYSEVGQEIHGRPAGSVMTIDFELENHSFVALNGGPHFTFNPSVSFFVSCTSEAKAEEIWSKLIEGGKAMMPLDKYEWSEKYGWLQDRFGLSWQIMLDTSGNRELSICPLLFFTRTQRGNAEKAIHFYTSIFKGSDIQGILKYTEEEGEPNGLVKHAQFQLEGQTFMAMDAGVDSEFPFNEAVSFIVHCNTQAEIDYHWNKLSEGGDPGAQQCGWLKDKFGLSWQVVPTEMQQWLMDNNSEKAKRVMSAMLQMKKLDINELRKSSEGEKLNMH